MEPQQSASPMCFLYHSRDNVQDKSTSNIPHTRLLNSGFLTQNSRKVHRETHVSSTEWTGHFLTWPPLLAVVNCSQPGIAGSDCLAVRIDLFGRKAHATHKWGLSRRRDSCPIVDDQMCSCNSADAHFLAKRQTKVFLCRQMYSNRLSVLFCM